MGVLLRWHGNCTIELRKLDDRRKMLSLERRVASQAAVAEPGPAPEPAHRVGAAMAVRVTAFGVVMALCYFAAAVLEVLLLSVLLAVLLEPAVIFLEGLRVPRSVAAAGCVLLLLAALYAPFVGLYRGGQEFNEQWPRYARVMRQQMQHIRWHVSQIREQAEDV